MNRPPQQRPFQPRHADRQRRHDVDDAIDRQEARPLVGSSRHSTASGRMSNVHSYRCAWGVTHSVSSTAPANASGRDARIRRQNPTYAAGAQARPQRLAAEDAGHPRHVGARRGAEEGEVDRGERGDGGDEAEEWAWVAPVLEEPQQADAGEEVRLPRRDRARGHAGEVGALRLPQAKRGGEQERREEHVLPGADAVEHGIEAEDGEERRAAQAEEAQREGERGEAGERVQRGERRERQERRRRVQQRGVRRRHEAHVRGPLGRTERRQLEGALHPFVVEPRAAAGATGVAGRVHEDQILGEGIAGQAVEPAAADEEADPQGKAQANPEEAGRRHTASRSHLSWGLVAGGREGENVSAGRDRLVVVFVDAIAPTPRRPGARARFRGTRRATRSAPSCPSPTLCPSRHRRRARGTPPAPRWSQCRGPRSR